MRGGHPAIGRLPAVPGDTKALRRASDLTVKALLRAGFKPGHGELNIKRSERSAPRTVCFFQGTHP
jgi:hypothetical protein